AWNTDTLAVARAGLDAHLKWLRSAKCAFAVACSADGQVLAGSTATRAGHIELHASAGLGDLARSIALRTFAGGLQKALPMAGCARVLTRDVEPHHSAADGSPEGHIYLVFEVRAGLGTFLRRGSASAAAAKNSGEDVAE